VETREGGRTDNWQRWRDKRGKRKGVAKRGKLMYLNRPVRKLFLLEVRRPEETRQMVTEEASVKLQPPTKLLRQICLFSNINALIGHCKTCTNCPPPYPVQCCFGHDACPYKSCGLQNNIERGEGGGQIRMQ